MDKKRFEVVGIGNAIVDMLANVEDDFIVQQNMKKGAMQLVDPNVSSNICDCIQVEEKNSGGSVANSIAGLACMGNRVAFVGKISKDAQGTAFEQSLKQLGVYFNTKKSDGAQPTGHCVVLITPDAQRTMNTCLGVAGALAPEDIDRKMVQDTKITFAEGYLWESPPAKEATYKAMDITKESGGQCALSLSDAFCVQRHRRSFLDLIDKKMDILFANEDEILQLFETESLNEALDACSKLDIICAITRSEQGSVIVKGGNVHHIQPLAPSKLTDTTGAGDLYAAGFLHGYLKGQDLMVCGKTGSIVAAEAISHFGARPKMPLLDLLKQKGC